jgi:hypothetical protein
VSEYEQACERFIVMMAYHNMPQRVAHSLLVRAAQLADVYHTVTPAALAREEHGICEEIARALASVPPTRNYYNDTEHHWSYVVGGLDEGDTTPLYVVPPTCPESHIAVPAPTPVVPVTIYDDEIRYGGHKIQFDAPRVLTDAKTGKRTAVRSEIIGNDMGREFFSQYMDAVERERQKQQGEFMQQMYGGQFPRDWFQREWFQSDEAIEEQKPVRSIDHLREKEQRERNRKARRGR